MRLRKAATFAFRVGLPVAFAFALLQKVVYPAEPPLKKVTVAYTSFAPFGFWFLLERDLGFFREEGLRPEFILVRGGGVAVRGLIAGNFDYVNPGSAVIDPIIRARQPFKIVLTTTMLHFWLVSQPGIGSITDLKGKNIGIASLGSTTDLVLREILKQSGLDPTRDATFLVVGSSRERLVALTSGAVHATALSPPFNFRAIDMGYRKLAKAIDYIQWPVGGWGTTEEKLRRDPQEVSKMVRAALKGVKFVLAQREYVLSKMMQTFHLSREEAIQTYETIQEEYVPSGFLAEEAQRIPISMIKQAANITGDIPPERVFDYRFVKQVERELKGWVPQSPK